MVKKVNEVRVNKIETQQGDKITNQTPKPNSDHTKILDKKKQNMQKHNPKKVFNEKTK